MQKFERGGQIYNAAGAAENFLDFSANINPLGVSEKVRAAIIENLDGIKNYPDPNATELKAAISQRYKVSAENLILVNGAAEFFYLYLNVTRPRKILIPVPSFSEYERAARAINAEIEYIFTRAEENFQLDFAQDFSADLIILGRPNNPTGNLISIDAIKKISNATKILLDESFIDFLEVESARNLVSEKITVVQSLTKIFAIPGLRLGFAVAEKNLAEKLNAAKDVWNVNFLAQKAGVAALSDEKFLQVTKSYLQIEKKYFVERLKKIPHLQVFEPTANFVLLKFDTAELAQTVLKKLRQEKILLRNCENFVGLDGRFLRSAIRSHEENLKLLDTLEKI
ncbi:MAG: aminotransferase class I/II-fold pyridoxal phosphate-dependent enzyme [Selenomonadaceae bacterium]|nr:aminotransferase class I/II-fold pyridoxal phosphate-dependent enzyme [Selenomonadaceae bacterium]